MFNYLNIVAFLVTAIALTKFVIPFLVSYPDTFTVYIGACLLVFMPPIYFYWGKAIFKSIKRLFNK